MDRIEQKWNRNPRHRQSRDDWTLRQSRMHQTGELGCDPPGRRSYHRYGGENLLNTNGARLHPRPFVFVRWSLLFVSSGDCLLQHLFSNRFEVLFAVTLAEVYFAESIRYDKFDFGDSDKPQDRPNPSLLVIVRCSRRAAAVRRAAAGNDSGALALQQPLIPGYGDGECASNSNDLSDIGLDRGRPA